MFVVLNQIHMLPAGWTGDVTPLWIQTSVTSEAKCVDNGSNLKNTFRELKNKSFDTIARFLFFFK